MEELNHILDDIIGVYNSELDNDTKHSKAADLWTKYYSLSKKLNIKLDQAYNLYLMFENESYIINQNPIRRKVDNDNISIALKHFEEVQNGERLGITQDDAINLLDWTVENTRCNLEGLCIDLNKSSLNGFCDIAQASTLMPLEDKGFDVKKLSATDTFKYPFNHYFGTVNFPIEENGKLVNKVYLIDVTFRQFFSTVRCNYGRYFTEEENYHIPTAPDPGFFVEDVDFAKELMGKGYILLDNESAKKYGYCFAKASLPYFEKENYQEEDYLDSIQNTFGNDYSISSFDLEGFNLDFPSKKLYK